MYINDIQTERKSEIQRGTFPEKVEKDIEGQEDELFENHVKHNEEKEMGLNASLRGKEQ